MILASVALLTSMVTGVGIWYGHRSIPIFPQRPDRPSRDSQSNQTPVIPKFSSGQQARQMLHALLLAGKNHSDEDLSFLISRLGDQRLLPAAPQKNTLAPKDNTQEKKAENPGPPSSIPGMPKPEQPRWVTVSSIAQEMLVHAAPQSIQPILKYLEAVKDEHAAEETSWSVTELLRMRPGIQVLGQIQLQALQKVNNRPPSPPMLLIGSSKIEWKGGSGATLSSEVRTEPLGTAWFEEPKINAAGVKPTDAHLPEFDVTPENFELVLNDLSKTLKRLESEDLKKSSTPQE